MSQSPAAFIDSIYPSQALEGQIVTFKSHGEDPDRDNIVIYRWESDIDGFLSDEKTFSTSRLTPGEHQITLRVKDSKDQWSPTVTRNLKVERKTVERKTPTITPAKTISSLPSAKIDKVWVDHNVIEENLLGMRIHVSFNINNLKDKTGRASAYFYTADGKALEDSNQRYYSVDGKVSSGVDFTPTYEESRFNDFTIFMPENELEIRAPGKYNLKFNIIIWYKGTKLDESDWTYFTYSK